MSNENFLNIKINFNFYRLLNVMNVSCITESVQFGGCLTGREVHCCGFSTTFLPMVMHTATLHCSLSTVTNKLPMCGTNKGLSHLIPLVKYSICWLLNPYEHG